MRCRVWRLCRILKRDLAVKSPLRDHLYVLGFHHFYACTHHRGGSQNPKRGWIFRRRKTSSKNNSLPPSRGGSQNLQRENGELLRTVPHTISVLTSSYYPPILPPPHLQVASFQSKDIKWLWSHG